MLFEGLGLLDVGACSGKTRFRFAALSLRVCVRYRGLKHQGPHRLMHGHLDLFQDLGHKTFNPRFPKNERQNTTSYAFST